MKIGFVDNSLWGQINFRGDLIEHLIKNGFEVVMISPKDTDLKIKNEAKYYNLKIERKSKNIFSDLKLMIKLFKIYKKEKFDLIFHYTIKPNIYGTIAAKLNNQTSISIVPGLGYTFIKENLLTKVVKLMYWFSLKFSNEVWFLNEEDKEYFVSNKLISEKKAKILQGEGVDTNRFKPTTKKTSEKTIFLMVARVLWDKGFKEYVEAAEKIKSKYKNIEFQLLGMIDNDNPSAVSKETVEYYHNNNIINYLGETKVAEKIIDKCDCLILPSFYREGIPRTLMEGGAMEKPLITTNNVGCKEVVDDGVNGFLCEIKNSDDLADKIEKIILLSREDREKMGKASRKKIINQFSNEIVFEKYESKIRGIKYKLYGENL